MSKGVSNIQVDCSPRGSCPKLQRLITVSYRSRSWRAPSTLEYQRRSLRIFFFILFLDHLESSSPSTDRRKAQPKMISRNSHVVLFDFPSSCHAVSAFSFVGASNFFSSTFRRTLRAQDSISCSKYSTTPSMRSPEIEIRKPLDRYYLHGNGPLWDPQNRVPTSRSEEVVSEFGLFLELVPMRMRNHLVRHSEIRNLIEVVMDLGRKPFARFPSGDWVISEQPVKPEDLRHAISKVVTLSLCTCVWREREKMFIFSSPQRMLFSPPCL